MSGYLVNGEKLRTLRRQVGLTQEKLASLSDCSDRLIRKAERNGSLKHSTIADIARQLERAGCKSIKTSDLILPLGIGIRSLAARFIKSYDLYGAKMLKHIDEFTDDFELCIPGDASVIPFAGRWSGSAGLQRFLDTFFADFTRKPNSLDPVFLECENQVTAKFHEQCAYKGHWLPSYWINLHFTFRDGMIARVENHYDTLKVHQDLVALRRQLGELQNAVS